MKDDDFKPGDLVRVLTNYIYGDRGDTLGIILYPPFDFKFYIPDDYVYVYVFKEHAQLWMIKHWLIKV